MAESFEGKISGIMQELINTLNNDTKFNAGIAEDFGKMTYPAAQLIPDESIYQNDLEYGDTFQINFVFEKNPINQDFIEATKDVEIATDTILDNLSINTPAKEFKPTNFRFRFAQNSNSRLTVIQVIWTVTRSHDFAA